MSLYWDDVYQQPPNSNIQPGGRPLQTSEVSKIYEAWEVPETYKIPKAPTQGYVNSNKSWCKETPSLQFLPRAPGMWHLWAVTQGGMGFLVWGCFWHSCRNALLSDPTLKSMLGSGGIIYISVLFRVTIFPERVTQCRGPWEGTNRRHWKSWNIAGQLTKPCLSKPWSSKAQRTACLRTSRWCWT